MLRWRTEFKAARASYETIVTAQSAIHYYK